MQCLRLCGLLLLVAAPAFCLAAGASADDDSDHDGLSDRLEDQLLARFAPRFMISRADCSVRPASFEAGTAVPTPLTDDGTIYGQAFPRRDHANEIELHFYHLWRNDCGTMGHRLDAEHVSVLLENPAATGSGKAETGAPDAGAWRAIYWYAAAHEDTLCDASQVTRAKSLGAESAGAQVWISAGKHASFLNEDLCHRGCGGDRCEQMEPLATTQIVNLGEPGAPMNGAVWSASTGWPLADKLRRSDFTEARLLRVERLPDTDVAWAEPGKRPARGAIRGANAGVGGAATGFRSANTAIVLADAHTGSAVNRAEDKTGSALAGSLRSVRKGVESGLKKAGKVIEGDPK